MPKSAVGKSRMFREYSRMKPRFIKHRGMQNLYHAERYFIKELGVPRTNLQMMCYMYELEFFTLKHIAKHFGMNEGGLARRNFPDLKHGDFIYKHFNKLTPSDTREDHIFRSETKYNYRVRWGLTQKGRLYVTRFYRMCAGEETIPGSSGS
jgi:hypothetical protein